MNRMDFSDGHARNRLVPDREPPDGQCDPVVDELDGYVGLGMQSEALRLAGEILDRPRLSGGAFAAAMDALLVQADALESWRQRVETAYERLNRRGRGSVRDKMLAFYGATEDWPMARRFVPRRPRHGFDLYFSTHTFLHLEQMEEAGRWAGRCQRALPTAENETEQALLLDALAGFCEHCGDLDTALECWETLPLSSPFAGTALISIVEIKAAQALRAARHCLQVIKELKRSGPDENEIILPQNRETCLVEAETRLRGLAKKLGKLVPCELTTDATTP